MENDRFADDRMKRVSRRMSQIYRQASEELTEKVDSFFESFQKMDEQKAQMVEEGRLSEEDYIEWRKNKMLMGKNYRDLRDTMSERMVKADEIAMSYMNGQLPAVYAHNYNLVGKEAGRKVKAFSFDLVNEQAVRKLSTSNKTLLPYKFVDGRRATRWHTKRVNSAMLQGILQGESIPKIAKRLQNVTKMNEESAKRNARTAMTGAQNKGRLDAMDELAKKGLHVKKRWYATTGDGRTRMAHLELHLTEVDSDKPFENALGQIMYPGDPDAAPANTYNCRCSIVTSFTEVFREAAEKKAEEEKQEEEKENEVQYSSNGITEPVRPRRSDFENEDDYYSAREEFKQKRDEYRAEIDRLVKEGASIKRFNSYDDVLAWAKSNNIGIDDDVLKTIDLRSFNETTMVLDEMFKRFPAIKSYDFEDFDGTMHKSSFRIGLDDTGLLSANGGLNFNPRLFQDYENGLRTAMEQQTDGYLVRADGTFGALVRHEYGHNVQDYIETKLGMKYHYFVDDWRKNYSTFEEYQRAASAYRTERNKYNSELLALAGLPGSSEYSNTNTLELFAEGFSEWASGSQTEFAIKFGEFLERWYP